MSIFKESFKEGVQTQLEIRQSVINDRTPQNLQYMNSRNAWIRMSSSVNIWSNNTIQEPTVEQLQDPGNYDNALAKQYILQGGTLSPNGTLKAGLGTFDKNAYSDMSSDGKTKYRLGIRPMPGITSVDVKSRGAYGSLQDVTVHFQCWDIHQLEDLELLYMRPGYTVLVEWGWAPYIDNNYEYKSTVEFYDIINQVKPKEEIWKDLAEKSEKNGSSQSMFGYVKNYSWSARMDGGYDCQVTIISLGEILESLKVNYLPAEVLSTVNQVGLLSPNIDTTKFNNGIAIDTGVMNLSSSYSKNILAGLFEEVWEIGCQIDKTSNGTSIPIYDKAYSTTYNLFHKTINIGDTSQGNGDIAKTDEQIYITLESLTNILNNYVLLRDNNNATGSKSPLAAISTKDKTGAPLLCLAHPLQISIDPSVCLIRNDLWAGGLKFNVSASVDTSKGTNVESYSNTDFAPLFNYLIDPKEGHAASYPANEDKIIARVRAATGKNSEEFRELQRQFLAVKAGNNTPKPGGTVVNQAFINYAKDFNNFYDLLDDSLKVEQINEILYVGKEDVREEKRNLNRKAIKEIPTVSQKADLNQQVTDLENAQSKGVEGIKFLKNIEPVYFLDNDYTKELGIIGNIFVNVTMLYNIAVDTNISGQDSKEKNEIAIYDFIKNVLIKISESIGSVNNFELFIEPHESVGRIIDINYVDQQTQADAYDNAFILEVHNLNSVVRSYKFESKIFPNQSSQVAIGAQVGGGALGVDASSLVAFNKKIRDRIIPIKDAPTSPTTKEENKKKLTTLTPLIKTLYEFFGNLKAAWMGLGDPNFNISKAADYKNALRDLIMFFVDISDSNIKGRAILPTVLSIEMDGIGGIIIGNIFRIPNELLPKGYKGLNGPGSKLGHIVTGLGHSLQNGDWVTKIDAQTIILDKPKGIHIEWEKLEIKDDKGSPLTVLPVDNKGNIILPPTTGNGQKALVPDTSYIKDNELDPIPGNYTDNSGNKVQLVVIDGRPVGKDIAKALIAMKKAAASNGITIVTINSGFRSPHDPIRTKSSKGVPVNAQSQQELYTAYLKNGKPLTAAPGKSNHGNAFAVDLNTGSVTGTIKTPLNRKVYQWLITNAYKYGFVRYVAKEEWHWEYRPGTYQYNDRVPKNNNLYNGMNL
jgi:hypothetical protein